MTDQVFSELTSFADVEELVLGHYKSWMNTWLSARERFKGIAPGTISRPRSYIVKQSFTALPGEERTPIVIAVSDGLRSAPARRGDGTYDAPLRFGIAAVVTGPEARATRMLAGHYQAALCGIAVRHRSINDGQIRMNEFVDLKIEDIDEEAIGRSMIAVRLELTYIVQSFFQEYPALVQIPDVPFDPQPDDPLVESVKITTEDLT